MTIIRTYHCRNCGGQELQAEAWIDLNLWRIDELKSERDGSCGTIFCTDCETHVKVDVKETEYP